MKAVSLTQPWATLVSIGAKRIETRSWSTSYRGKLAIQASKGFAREDVRLANHREPFKTVLTEAGYPLFSTLPRGAIIAVCNLIEVVRIPAQPQLSTLFVRVGSPLLLPPDPDSLERAFGDYAPGRYAWVLSDIHKLVMPIPVRGALSLWDWDMPDNLEMALLEEIAR